MVVLSMKLFFKYLLAFFMILAGLNHFINPDIYLQIMPSYLPWPLFLIYLSGVLETLFGILLCVPVLSKIAAWGLIVVLIGIFPANINMALHSDNFDISSFLLWLRLPLQGLLIAWAYRYTKPFIRD
jgi:uncharacterized membrane protein